MFLHKTGFDYEAISKAFTNFIFVFYIFKSLFSRYIRSKELKLTINIFLFYYL